MLDSYQSENNVEEQPEPHGWRRVVSLLWLLFVAGLIAWFIITKRSELGNIGHVLRSANRSWILVAGVVELTILTLMTKTYQSILESLGHQIRLHLIVSSYLRGLAVGTVLPFGGPAAMIVFIRSLTQQGVPTNDAVFATTLASLSGFASFLVILVLVLLSLFFTGQLPTIVLWAAAALVVAFVVAVSAVVIPLRWERIPSWITRYMPGWMGRFLLQAHSHHIHVRDLRRPFVYSLGVDVCGGAMLYASLLSVGEASKVLAAFAGYQVEMLFNVITPLFQGIGIADLSIAVALNELGVALSQAAAATLVYRLWDLWVPLLLGTILYLLPRRRGSQPA